MGDQQSNSLADTAKRVHNIQARTAQLHRSMVKLIDLFADVSALIVASHETKTTCVDAFPEPWREYVGLPNDNTRSSENDATSERMVKEVTAMQGKLRTMDDTIQTLRDKVVAIP